jgi:hypothetical protein
MIQKKAKGKTAAKKCGGEEEEEEEEGTKKIAIAAMCPSDDGATGTG